eukprot:5861422-Ditylum_brightwellii.AAC.1
MFLRLAGCPYHNECFCLMLWISVAFYEKFQKHIMHREVQDFHQRVLTTFVVISKACAKSSSLISTCDPSNDAKISIPTEGVLDNQ